MASIPHRNAIRALPFVHLEINEAFPHLGEGKGNLGITELSNMFPRGWIISAQVR
ncbi:MULTISPECIES: hypothetical protein [Symbiopectobacterium]|uniref:hypothetical protein n=1 Tax=Symbiopectobacterium TaxID=801 RepID=UPI00207A1F05|nr:MULTISPECIES: hypothetical protein [Symbiopectobacterium]MBT9429863.1 hypothetical protein [Candidatus Symbiopectobacterium endolongispinus]